MDSLVMVDSLCHLISASVPGCKTVETCHTFLPLSVYQVYFIEDLGSRDSALLSQHLTAPYLAPLVCCAGYHDHTIQRSSDLCVYLNCLYHISSYTMRSLQVALLYTTLKQLIHRCAVLDRINE